MNLFGQNRLYLQKIPRTGLFLFGIVALSVFVRFRYTQLQHVPVGDESQYISVAKNVFEGKGWVKETDDPADRDGYRTADDIMPLYIGFVLAAHHLTGYRHRNADYVNLVFSALLTILVYLVAARIFRSNVMGLFSALLVSFDPVITKMTWHATKDISFCVSVFAFLFVLLHSDNRRFYPLTAVALALLVLSRRNGYWFIPPLLIHFIINGRESDIGGNIRAFFFVVAGAGILVSPWYIYTALKGRGELSIVLEYAMGGVTDGPDGTPNLIGFLRSYKTQLQVGLIDIIRDSSVLTPLLLFVPFAAVSAHRKTLDVFLASSLAVFLLFLSLRSFPETSLHFYYLPFFPILIIYGTAGFLKLLPLYFPKPALARVIVALGAAICLLPVSEEIRNHVHPVLRGKNDDIAVHRELKKVISFINNETSSTQTVVGCSRIRHYLYDIEPRVIALPENKNDFTREFFIRHNARFLVIGVRNLRQVESATARPYTRTWWDESHDSIWERSIPEFLEKQFRTPTQIVYRFSPAQTDSLSGIIPPDSLQLMQPDKPEKPGHNYPNHNHQI